MVLKAGGQPAGAARPRGGSAGPVAAGVAGGR